MIYITGLGDQKPVYQPQIINLWKKFGVTPHYSPVGWADGEAFRPKLDRFCHQVDELSAGGNTVSLVGISAGAGAALNVYMERKDKINSVVFICGKIVGFTNVNPNYFSKNPAFRESLQLTQENLPKLTPADKLKMLSVHPLYDQTVPIAVTKIPGVKSKLIISVLHIPSIFMAITIYRRVFLKFLIKRAGVI